MKKLFIIGLCFIGGQLSASQVEQKEKHQAEVKLTSEERAAAQKMFSIILSKDYSFNKIVDLLEHYPKIMDAKNQSGLTPLMIAASNGFERLTQLLLSLGAHMNAQDNAGETALLHALRKKDNDTIINLLIDAGANLNIKGDMKGDYVVATSVGLTPLLYEDIKGNKKNAYGLSDGLTPLLYEATWKISKQSGTDKILHLLIARGADVNAQDKEKHTALMLTAYSHDWESVKLLLKAGAQADMQDKNGWTALMYACSENSILAARELLAGGADPNIQNNNGWTALMFAAEHSPDAVKWLIRDGADPEIKNNENKIARDYAEDKNQYDALMEEGFAMRNAHMQRAVNAKLKNPDLTHIVKDYGF